MTRRFVFGGFFAVFIASAQLNAQFTLGIRIGTSSNGVQLNRDTPIKVSHRINGLPGTMGLMSGFQFSHRWGLEMGLNYTVKGYDDNTLGAPQSTTPGNKATGFRFHYAELCPQLTFRWKPEFSLKMGGYAGYLFKREGRNPGFNNWDPLSDSFDGFFRDLDAGLSASFSVCYQRLSFFVQFQQGLFPIAAFNYSTSSDTAEVRMYNRTFMLGVGYALLER